MCRVELLFIPHLNPHRILLRRWDDLPTSSSWFGRRIRQTVRPQSHWADGFTGPGRISVSHQMAVRSEHLPSQQPAGLRFQRRETHSRAYWTGIADFDCVFGNLFLSASQDSTTAPHMAVRSSPILARCKCESGQPTLLSMRRFCQGCFDRDRVPIVRDMVKHQESL